MSTACPICGRTIPAPPPPAGDGAESPAAPLPESFPFCSRRCRLIDLGRWFDGLYRIPGAPMEAAADGPGREPGEYPGPGERHHLSGEDEKGRQRALCNP